MGLFFATVRQYVRLYALFLSQHEHEHLHEAVEHAEGALLAIEPAGKGYDQELEGLQWIIHEEGF